MTELFAGATSYWLVLAKSGGGTAGGCWRYLLPRRRRGRCLLGCVSWVGRSSSGGSHCSAAPGLRALGRFGATTDGKICAPCMIRGARAAKGAPSWQDLRAVYSQTAVCGAFRMHGAHILPKPAHFGCMARESCRELAIFPSEAPSEMHETKKLPRIAARERTAREYCHCQSGQERIRAQSCHRRAPRNAFRERFAIVERLGTYQGIILPRPDARAERSARPCATTPCSTMPCAAAPQRPALQHHDAMHRTRRFCRR